MAVLPAASVPLPLLGSWLMGTLGVLSEAAAKAERGEGPGECPLAAVAVAAAASAGLPKGDVLASGSSLT